MPLESSVIDITIFSVIIELSTMIPQVSFTLVYDVYSTSITYNDCQSAIIICLQHRPLEAVDGQWNSALLKFLTIVRIPTFTLT